MKYTTLILILFFSSSVYSQTNKNSKKESALIKFCPLALIDDMSFPTIQGGFEFKLSKKMTWYNEIGIKYRKSVMENTDTSFLNSYGFKLKTEFRYYFQKKYRRRTPKTYQGLYSGANLFFTHDEHNTQIEYYHNTNDAQIFTDVFGVKKNVYGLNLIFGYQKLLSRKLGFDSYVGLGVRVRDITTVHEEYNKNTDHTVSPIDLNIRSMRDESDANAGTKVLPDLTFGFRLIYKL
jgi:hypothetical protein